MEGDSPADEGPVHVVPLNDLIEHACDEGCICGPTVTEEGVVVHHSLDGREFAEPDYQGPLMPTENA